MLVKTKQLRYLCKTESYLASLPVGQMKRASTENKLRRAELAFIWRAAIYLGACETKNEHLLQGENEREQRRQHYQELSITACALQRKKIAVA